MRPGRGLQRRGRADVDEHAPALLAHVRDEGLGGERDRLHVDREDAVELGLLDLHQRLVAVGGAGVVDHDVDPAERRDRLLRRPLDVVALRNVRA